MQVRAAQIAAVMEGDLAGEAGRAAAAVVEAADAARAWSAGKGGAFYAQGEGYPNTLSISLISLTHTFLRQSLQAASALQSANDCFCTDTYCYDRLVY